MENSIHRMIRIGGGGRTQTGSHELSDIYRRYDLLIIFIMTVQKQTTLSKKKYAGKKFFKYILKQLNSDRPTL